MSNWGRDFYAKEVARLDKVRDAERAIEKTERLKRLESTGDIDPNCKGCEPYYEHPVASPFCPNHKASARCESGGYNHCTCDTCF